MSRSARLFAVVALLLSLVACAPKIPREALLLQPDTLARRQLQTRKFETNEELKLMQASASVLQDLGFTIEESETKLGVIAGAKSRDATSAGQVVGMVVVAALGGRMAIDKVQHIRASVVSRAPEPGYVNVRVTFQRTVINDQGQISRTEGLEDPVLYQEFFDKLSKSVFLQANDI